MHKEDRQIFIIKLIIGILSVLTVALICCQFAIERNSTEFELIGDKEVTIKYGEKYQEMGFVANSNGENVSDKVKVISDLNEKKVGIYTIKYNLKLSYLNINKTLIRKVEVRDYEKPEIIINGEKKVKLYVDDKFDMPTYVAVDNVDGDITNNVIVNSNLDLSKTGTYEIKYEVEDSSKNKTTEKIVINVEQRPKNAYIDISIGSQKLRYYEYDKLVLESDIVTGINNGTPTGNYRVLSKSRNVNLRGADYVSFVNYWIAFIGQSYGMHDASWRSSFGGNIYKYNGSHGCVNMPYSKVKQLYNMVELGTPVYIKY